eukprot:gene24922-biopygen10474
MKTVADRRRGTAAAPGELVADRRRGTPPPCRTFRHSIGARFFIREARMLGEDLFAPPPGKPAGGRKVMGGFTPIRPKNGPQFCPHDAPTMPCGGPKGCLWRLRTQLLPSTPRAKLQILALGRLECDLAKYDWSLFRILMSGEVTFSRPVEPPQAPGMLSKGFF